LPESEQHRSVKEILEQKLHEWFGASISEYPSSGHELDVFAVTANGISIYVEVIWNHSLSHFRLDMNMLQQSDADVKVVVGSPKVVADGKMMREFAKVVISQRKTGKQIQGEIINGLRVLEDSNYVEYDLRRLFDALINQAYSQTNVTQAEDSWIPPPKLNFFVTQRRGSSVLQLPAVAFNLINQSPYQLIVRLEVRPILGEKNLGLIPDRKGYYNGKTKILAEPNGGGFINGCFTIPQECATSNEECTLEVRAILSDQNNPDKSEYRIVKSWTYMRKENAWFYEPKAFTEDFFADKEILNNFRIIIDRPAMHQPFRIEGNMLDFLQAITDIIRALNTGIMKTREGDEIRRTKPRSMLSNPNWAKKIELITSEFEDLRTRFESARRSREMILRSDGFYAFNSREPPHEIDMKREKIIRMFNELLQEAGLAPIRGIGMRNSFW
jgi:hypothetical protein